jgi:opacity protein-like surface antigen
MRTVCVGLLSCFLLLASTQVTHAQLGLYGKFDLTRQSNTVYPGTASASQTFYGGGVGLYDDFIHLGPIHAGADFRGDFLSGGNYNYRTFLGGVRVAVKPPVLPIRPYVQFSAGVGGTQYKGSINGNQDPYHNKFLYAVLGGIDWAILPHVDFRAIEVGVGHQSSDTPSQSDTLILVGSGLALRF